MGTSKNSFSIALEVGFHWGTSGFAELIYSPEGVRMEQRDTATPEAGSQREHQASQS